MNYLTNYYKNLCEQLQEKITVLEAQLNEAGLKKALKTKDPELLKKEKMKAGERRERYFDAAIKANVTGAMQKYGASSPEAGIAGMEHEIRHQQAREMIQNINKLEDAEQRNLTPNVHDGPDEDSAGSTSEVIDSQRRNQMTGKLGSSALETAGMFPDMKASLNRLSIRKK